MFYEHPSFRQDTSSEVTLESALVVLTPSESKRLIAKAVAVLPEVTSALEKGMLVITMGTTNAYVVEEILGITIEHKSDFSSGVVCEGELRGNHPDTKILPFVIHDGGSSDLSQYEALLQFKPGDVFIKGANAVDINGDIGILVAGQSGGSLRDAWFAVTGCGGEFICPVGLDKFVPSVKEASQKCGIFRFKLSMGLPTALVLFSNAKVVTEIQAIRVLTGAYSTFVSSGGIGGSEGAVILSLEGDELTLGKAFDLIKSIKGEPPVPPPRKYATPSAVSLNYDPVAISQSAQYVIKDPRIYGEYKP